MTKNTLPLPTFLILLPTGSFMRPSCPPEPYPLCQPYHLPQWCFRSGMFDLPVVPTSKAGHPPSLQGLAHALNMTSLFSPTDGINVSISEVTQLSCPYRKGRGVSCQEFESQLCHLLAEHHWVRKLKSLNQSHHGEEEKWA